MDLLIFAILFLLSILLILLSEHLKDPMFLLFPLIIFLFLGVDVFNNGLQSSEIIPSTALNCVISSTALNCTSSGNAIQTVSTSVFSQPLFDPALGLLLLLAFLYVFFKFYQGIEDSAGDRN